MPDGCTKYRKADCMVKSHCNWDRRCRSAHVHEKQKQEVVVVDDDTTTDEDEEVVVVDDVHKLRKARQDEVAALRIARQKATEARLAMEVAEEASRKLKQLANMVEHERQKQRDAAKKEDDAAREQEFLEKSAADQRQKIQEAMRIARYEAQKAALAKTKKDEQNRRRRSREAKDKAQKESDKKAQLLREAEEERLSREQAAQERDEARRMEEVLVERARQESERKAEAVRVVREAENVKRREEEKAKQQAALGTVTENLVLDGFLRCVEDNRIGGVRLMAKRSLLPIGVVDLQVINRGKTYVVTGKYLKQRDVRAILPVNYQVGKTVAQYVKAQDEYSYEHNDVNREKLVNLFGCVRRINAQFFGQSVVREGAPYITAPKFHGILQWDVPCVIPDWINAVTQENTRLWDPKQNPRVAPNGTITFGDCRIDYHVTRRSVHALHKIDPKWQAIASYDVQLQMNNDGTTTWFNMHTSNKPGGYNSFDVNHPQNPMRMFLADHHTTVLAIGWTDHARAIFKDSQLKIIYLLDPWMQDVDKSGSPSNKGFKVLQSFLKPFGYILKFIQRKPDQGNEGSCMALSLLRIILMAEYGVEGAKMPIPRSYAVMVGRFIRMFK